MGGEGAVGDDTALGLLPGTARTGCTRRGGSTMGAGGGITPVPELWGQAGDRGLAEAVTCPFEEIESENKLSARSFCSKSG